MTNRERGERRGWSVRRGVRPGSVRVLPLLLLAAVSFLAACGEARDTKVTRTPLILVTVPPQAEIVRRIAGPLVEIEVLVPPDADPHTFEPTVAQMQAVSRASAYFLVGHPALEFEAIWRSRLAREGGDDLRFIDGTAGLELILDDPHVWVSPSAMKVMAANLTAGLTALLPAEETRLQEGLARFLGEVELLDTEIRTLAAAAPRRSFLVQHAAWGWFARDYGLEQIAIERGHIQPGPAHIAELVDRARREGITTVFAQPQTGLAQAETFAAEIGGHVEIVDPLAEHWFEAMRAAARAFLTAPDPGGH